MGRQRKIPDLGKKLVQIGCLAGFTGFFYAEILNPGIIGSFIPVFRQSQVLSETEDLLAEDLPGAGTDGSETDGTKTAGMETITAETKVPSLAEYVADASPGISYALNPSLPVRASWEELSDTLSSMVASYEGTWSVSVKELASGQGITLNDEPQSSASLIKLFIMGAVLDAVNEGDLEYSDEIAQLLQAMISVSDNDAANELVRYLDPDHDHQKGMEAVNAYILENGYTGTVLNNGLADPDLWYEPESLNQTTARDCVDFLTAVYEGSCVSHLMSHRMEALLMDQEILYKIPAGLPEDVVTASKSGETDDTENDAAIVYSPGGDYAICVMATNLTDNDLAVDQIRDISETVYNFFNTSESAGIQFQAENPSFVLVSPPEDYDIVTDDTETELAVSGGTETETAASGGTETETVASGGIETESVMSDGTETEIDMSDGTEIESTVSDDTQTDSLTEAES